MDIILLLSPHILSILVWVGLVLLLGVWAWLWNRAWFRLWWMFTLAALPALFFNGCLTADAFSNAEPDAPARHTEFELANLWKAYTNERPVEGGKDAVMWRNFTLQGLGHYRFLPNSEMQDEALLNHAVALVGEPYADVLTRLDAYRRNKRNKQKTEPWSTEELTALATAANAVTTAYAQQAYAETVHHSRKVYLWLSFATLLLALLVTRWLALGDIRCYETPPAR